VMYVVISPKIIPRQAVNLNVGALIIAIKKGERQRKQRKERPFLKSSFGNARGKRIAEEIVRRMGIM
jgi:hypothetical protein